MTSIDFPTLTSGVSQNGFEYVARDFTLKDAAEYPYTYSRPKATRNVSGWTVPYRDLSNTDFRALWDFWGLVKTAVSFNWTDPTTATSYEVRFSSMGNPSYAGYSDDHLWDVSFSLEEV